MRPPLAAAAELATRHLEREGLRPVVVAHDIWLAAGLQGALPETALACISASDAIDTLRQRGTEVFCLSEEIGATAAAAMSSLDLLRHDTAKKFFATLGPTAVIAFKPSERIEEAVGALGGRLLAAPSSAARAYENKLAFIDAAERAGVPRPRWRAMRLPQRYSELAADFGERVVVQGARGNAGQRTWMVGDQASLDAVGVREPGALVRVSEFVEGTPFTASGVTFSAPGSGLARGRLAAVVEPCRQVTGIPWLTPEELGSCGNVWGDTALDAHSHEVARCVHALAADLSARNYHGVFGVDFVLASDGPLVIEVNPRMVASLPVATELEIEAGRAPLILLHMLELLDADLDSIADRDSSDDENAPATPLADATQVIVHRLPGDAEERPRGGIYRVDQNGAVQFVRPGAGLADLDPDGDLLLLTRRSGEPVTDRKEYARVYTRSSRGEDSPALEALVAYLRSGAR
ncbi:MAG: ATP-grasp domain-containing protein [Candidatus Dormibacteria bacterium]